MENTLSSQALEALIYCMCFFSLFVGFNQVFLSKGFTRKWRISPGVAMDMSCKCVSAIFGLMCTAAGLFVFAKSDSRPGVEEDPAVDRVIERFLILALSYFLYDVYAMYQVFCAKSFSKEASEVSFEAFFKAKPLLTVHHLVLALFFVPLMWNCRDHEPGNLMLAVALVMEASTPFVSARSVLSDMGLKKSRLYVANGLLMVVVFFLCRIFPYLAFYVAYSSVRRVSVMEAVASTPKQCVFFVILTLAPQLYWFNVMLKGAVKVVQHRSKDPSKNF